jgi:ribosomal protein S18 acetylase RimI-like enzyme
MMLVIRRATLEDADSMQSGFDGGMGWTKPAGYFATCCAQQERGELVLLVAEDGGSYRGHAKVVWQPDYPYFRENGIPEIQDLNVLTSFRRQGIATQLLDVAEALIIERSTVAGIGFGLYADYGAAQRLYVKRGYVPDGRGVVYRDEYVRPGATVAVDDDLVLYLTKTF